MLELKGIVKAFHKGTVNEKIALRGIDLRLEDGDFVTVIGGNGAGKSTLLNSIAGVFSVDEGSLHINDVDVTHMAEYKRAKYIGRVFQDPMLGTAGNMQIEENMLLALRRGKQMGLSWAFKENERELFKQQLARLDLGLENRLSSSMGLLSGGQRQSITLLMATMLKPEVLLLDEHTAALDPKAAAKIMKLTQEIVKKHHITCLMVTHQMQQALEVGDRTIMMNDGHIVIDIKGEQTENMSVYDIMERFHANTGSNLADDRILLAK